ncbi:MAG: hypothetical protein FWJ70_07060 [Micromonosporaceae bacterium]|jgi:hypothetical protein
MNDTTIVLRRRPSLRSWLALGASAAAVVVMLLLIAVACQAANRSDDDLSAPPPSTSTSDGSPAPSGDAGGDGDPDGGEVGPGAGSGRDGGGQNVGQNGGGRNGGGRNGGGQDGGGQQPTTPPGPVIEYFHVALEPLCPGSELAPMEGRPVVLEWKVTGTDQVTLSVDGPGVYATYPAQGSATLNFPCEGREGATQRHTYLLTATNSDGTTTSELVVEAQDHERTQVGG